MSFTLVLFACWVGASLPDRLNLKCMNDSSFDRLLLTGPVKFDIADLSMVSLLDTAESRVLPQKPEETLAGFVIESSFLALML
jgi:hypothetical protein